MLQHLMSPDYRPGFRSSHPDTQINFQFNRWLPFMDEREVEAAASRILNLADWKRELAALGDAAKSSGRFLHASTYYRAAEFFMVGEEPHRAWLNAQALEIFDRAVAHLPLERHEVPYRSGALPALKLRARGRCRDTLVIHGGFDSCKEEYIAAAPDYAERGFDVVIFDGPGQGQALRQHGLTMDAAWEKPVGAILDHFQIASCTLMGFSLGGYLAPRAAAFDARIVRVIADDVLMDFFTAFTGKAGAHIPTMLEEMIDAGERAQVNETMRGFSETSESVAWAIAHGREVSGAVDDFDFLVWLLQLRTAGFSDKLHQDFLLMGAKEDHIVPVSQFYRQAEALSNVRSLTAQLFTRADDAEAHCHVGNTPMIVRYVINWIEFQLTLQEERTQRQNVRASR